MPTAETTSVSCQRQPMIKHRAAEQIVTDPETEFTFKRESCAYCGCWLGDTPIGD